MRNVYRSCRSGVFYKKAILKNFTKFQGKTCVQVFFNSVAGTENEFSGFEREAKY